MPGQNSVSFLAPAGPGEPLAGADSAGGREGEPASADCRHRGARRRAGHAAAAAKPDEPKPAQADETVVLAFVGAAPMVRIDWTPKAEGATGLAALVSVEAEQQVWINEGATPQPRQPWSTRSAAPNWANWPWKCRPITKWSTSSTPTCGSGRSSRWPKGRSGRRSPPNCSSPPRRSSRSSSSWKNSPAKNCNPPRPSPVVKALDVGRQQGSVVVQVAAGLRGRSHPRHRLAPGRRRRAARRAPPPALDFLLSLRHAPLRAGPGRRRVGAAGHGRLAGRGAAGARAAHARRDGGLHHRARRGLQAGTRRACRASGSATSAAATCPAMRPNGRRPCKSTRTVSKARRRTAWWSTSPTRRWAASPWPSSCRRTCRSPKLLAPTGEAAEIALPVPQVAAGTCRAGQRPAC